MDAVDEPTWTYSRRALPVAATTAHAKPVLLNTLEVNTNAVFKVRIAFNAVDEAE